MKRMIDQASFEKASSDIKEIQDALSGKDFFDGSITVVTIGGDKGIKKANLPTTAGTYKLSSGGVLVVKINSASSITITAIYGASMYTETRDPASTADFKFIEDNRMGDKPIYCHPITLIRSNDILTTLVFNNSPTPFTLETFADWLFDLYAAIGDVVRVMASGAFIHSDVPHIASFIGVNTSGALLYGSNANTGTQQIVTIGSKSAFIEYFTTLFDGVNRIN